MRTILIKAVVGIAIGLFTAAVKSVSGCEMTGFDTLSLAIAATFALSAVIIVNAVVDIYIHYYGDEKPWWERDDEF